MIKFTIGLALVLAACGGDKKAGDKAATSDTMKEFEDFKDRMCACTDAACGNKVLDEWRDWRKKAPKPSDDDKAKIKEIDGAFHDCERKVGAGS